MAMSHDSDSRKRAGLALVVAAFWLMGARAQSTDHQSTSSASRASFLFAACADTESAESCVKCTSAFLASRRPDAESFDNLEIGRSHIGESYISYNKS